MKTKLLFFLILIGLTNQVISQQFYYSSKKKNILIEDTTIIAIRLKDNQSSSSVIKKLSPNLFEKVDTAKGNAEFKIKKGINKKDVLSVIRKYPEVLYAWHSIKSNNSIIIPTGEIVLLPIKGLPIDSLISKTGIADKVQKKNKDKYGVVSFSVVNEDSLFSIANLLYESKLVEWCHPDFWIPIQHNTNDPLYSDQWYLKNTGQFSGTSGIDINIEGAWGVTTGSSSIKIAVIDEGVEDHEDISGRVLSGYTTTNSSGYGSPSGNHGEACAGIIAASQNNLTGIAGIASNCYILPINIFEGGPSAQQIANGINWAWDNGSADVLSNSWGAGSSYDVITQAISNARTYGRGGKGSIVVFASGNDYGSVAYPGNVDGVITVGAIDNNGSLWSYSNTGASMDLVAPSSDGSTAGIRTTDRMGSVGYNSGNYTTSFSGTSAACPQVSGVAALMLSVNPNLTETQAKAIIQNTATDMGSSGFDNIFGYGRLNACAAVYSSLYISGDDIVCGTSNTFSIPNIPSGVSVSWSASPGGIISIGCSNCQSTTISKSSNGVITLTAAISSPCGTIYISKSVIIGMGTNSINYTQKFMTCEGNHAYFYGTVQATPAATNYDWYAKDESNSSNPFVLKQTGLGNQADFPLSGSNKYFTIRVVVTNPCGTLTSIDEDGYIFADACSAGASIADKPVTATQEAPTKISIFPNPARLLLYITVPADSMYLPNTSITLIDISGKSLRKITTVSETNSMNIAGISGGVYLIQITDGKRRIMKKVIIN